MVYNVLLRPLPFPDPDRLMVVSYQPADATYWLYPGVVDGHYVALRDANRHFEATATFGSAPVTLTGAGDSVRLEAAAVTPDFFRVLAVEAAIGRTFVPEDAQAPESDRTVVIGDALWRGRFGADAGIIGRRIALDGVAHTVVGVMPPGLVYPAQSALWTPLAIRLDARLSYTRPVIARLKPGETRAQALAGWEALTAGLAPTPGSSTEWRARVTPLKDAVVGGVRAPLLVFVGAVALVLFIACANVSNLLLMRTLSRRRELATRMALGAGRVRVWRQLLTETCVLALAGGVAGTAVMMAGVPALLALLPAGRLPRESEIQVDGWVLGFTFVVALASGLILGLLPALHGLRAATVDPWRDDGTRVARRSEWLRSTLVAGEVALALVLLVGAGLLVKSFARLTAVEMGFQPSRVMTMTVSFPPSAYPTAPLLQGVHERLLESISRIPGVAAAGAVNWLPLGNHLIRGNVLVRNGDPAPDYWVTKASVSPGYFSAMGIRIQRGRGFLPTDTSGSPGVIIVSESVARQLWPGQEAVGQQLSMVDRPAATDWLSVVGVVPDIRQTGVKDELVPAVYQPYWQVRSAFFLSQMSFVARTADDPARLAPAMRAALGAADASLAPQSMGSMESLIAGTIAEPRFQTRLLVVFSALALVLAAIGVYGVLAASVTERRREIGIRLALGAQRTAVVSMVLGRVLMLTLVGGTIGLTGALAASRVLSGMLFEIAPTDGAAFAGAGATIVTVAVLAALVPARRASAVDPAAVLRAE